MLNKKIAVIPACVIALFAYAETFAGDSSTLTAPTPVGMTLCSDWVMNSSSRATSTTMNVPLAGVADCVDGYGGGGVGWGGIPGLAVGMGGNFNPDCPSSRPYMGGLVEGWGGDWYVAGGAGMTVTCCSVPSGDTMSLTTGNNPGVFNTWQAGTDCN